MSLPTLEPLPEEHTTLPPARRRRQRRMFLPPEVGDRAEFLTELVRQTVPSVDYFLFSILSGLILGLALLLDAPALVFLAVLAAPFMAPAVGISLGTITGAAAYILQSLGSLGIGSLIVFVCGALAGMIAGVTAPLPPESGAAQALQLSRFSWAGLLVLLVGAALTSYQLVRSPEQRPLVPGLALAYGLYLPLGAAGYSLGSGMGSLWLDGLVLFFIHLVWTAFTGVLVLALLGIRPLTTRGYIMSVVYGLCGILLVVLVSPRSWSPVAGPGQQPGVIAGESTQPAAEGGEETQPAIQGPLPSPSPSFTVTPAPSATPTATQEPSPTPTATITPLPTPAWATIFASEGGGALIRVEPNFDANAVTSVINGTLVEVLPDPVQDGAAVWLHVRLPDGREGWILQALLRTATPAPAAP